MLELNIPVQPSITLPEVMQTLKVDTIEEFLNLLDFPFVIDETSEEVLEFAVSQIEAEKFGILGVLTFSRAKELTEEQLIELINEELERILEYSLDYLDEDRTYATGTKCGWGFAPPRGNLNQTKHI